jgi:hypothetical protein
MAVKFQQMSSHAHLNVERVLSHHQRPVVSHMNIGILVCHRMTDWHHTWIQWTPCRRFAWQKVLNFSFVSEKGDKGRSEEVNLIFIVNIIEHDVFFFEATGYFIIHQTLIFPSALLAVDTYFAFAIHVKIYSGHVCCFFCYLLHFLLISDEM